MGVTRGVTLGVTVVVDVAVGVAVGVADGLPVGVAVGVGVGGAPDCAQYLPPLSKSSERSLRPPQMIISLPVQIPVWPIRAAGAFVVLVAIHVSLPGLYLPPVSKVLLSSVPPHTIISLPVQTAVCK